MTRLQTISSPYFEDGFLPSQPAVSRLPSQWDAWEDILSEAASRLGFDLSPSPNGISELDGWRDSVRKVRVLSSYSSYRPDVYPDRLDGDSSLIFLDASLTHARDV